VVGDIDRGGVFAAFHGTVALLDADDQRLISGFIVNRFRGDPKLLAPGLDQIRALTGRPVLGTVPYLPDLHLDAEDSLALDPAPDRHTRPPLGRDTLRVTVIRLPRISNFTDVDALAAEPGVELTFATTPGALAGADLVVLPGTRATVSDLAWLRERGLDAALAERVATGGPVFGICGGYQMLGQSIDDLEHVESPSDHVDGLGLLPVSTEFTTAKTLTRPRGLAHGEPVDGYEIHHGRVTVHGGEPFITDGAGSPLDGCRLGPVTGTLWHGVCENDAFRRALLAEVAAATGRAFVPSQDTNFAALRESQLDRLAEAVAAHIDTDALARLIEHGPPADLPLLWPGAGPA
jgi:adenosylcobyric acid synthase